MARRSKLEKISEIKSLPNVFEKPEGLKGCWHENVFENQNPITLEIGCGRGEYTIGLARKFAGRNFIGADIKGPRIWKGAKTAYDESIDNAAFVRTLIENIPDYFSKGEIDEIWVTFPDPYPKPSKAQKRLISERFLRLYSQILKTNGMLHFKTDNTELFNWAIEQFKGLKGVNLLEYTEDLYHSALLDDITEIKTTYEQKFLAEGKTIKYARLQLE